MINDVLKTAFQYAFNVDSDRVFENEEIADWIQEAPGCLVDFDSYLDKEDAHGRDYRMRLYKVYDGEYKELGDYLRKLYPEMAFDTDLVIIFKVYNCIENITDTLQKVVAYGLGPDTKSVSAQGSAKKTGYSQDISEVSQDLESTVDSVEPKNISNYEEEQKMAESILNIETLVAEANGAKPVDANLDAVEAQIKQTINERAAFTASNRVSKAVIQYETADKRLVSDMAPISGCARKKNGGSSPALARFCALTGFQLPKANDPATADKYPHVVDKNGDGAEYVKADAILAMILAAAEDNERQFKVFKKAGSSKILGFELNNDIVSKEKMAQILGQQAAGALYFQGQDAKTVKPVTVKLSHATVKQQAGGKGAETAVAEVQTIITSTVSVTNKSALDELNATAVAFATAATKSATTVKNRKFDAEIEGMEGTPAVLTVRKFDKDGNAIMKPTKDGSKKQATMTYRLKLNAEIYTTVETIDGKYESLKTDKVKPDLKVESKASAKEIVDWANADSVMDFLESGKAGAKSLIENFAIALGSVQ